MSHPTRKEARRALRLCLAATLALVATSVAAAEPKELFVANKCSQCHSMERYDITRTMDVEKTRGPDLSEVGDCHDAEWMTGFIMKTVELNGKKHLNNYKGTKKDLEALVGWLAQQKAGG